MIKDLDFFVSSRICFLGLKCGKIRHNMLFGKKIEVKF